MTTRGILFSASMVRAILAGVKTQTRRAAKRQHFSADFHARGPDVGVARALAEMWDDAAHVKRPYGRPGDRLWVRETWGCDAPLEEARAKWDDAMPADETIACLFYRATHDPMRDGGDPARWRPAIHMPRWASRLALDVTGVRLERLHAITEADARAEGVADRAAYERLWGEINGAESWDANPWVWVIAFRRTT